MIVPRASPLFEGRSVPEPSKLLTTVDDGIDGMRFIIATPRSSENGSVRVLLD
jgi:hypothetical protein